MYPHFITLAFFIYVINMSVGLGWFEGFVAACFLSAGITLFAASFLLWLAKQASSEGSLAYTLVGILCCCLFIGVLIV